MKNRLITAVLILGTFLPILYFSAHAFSVFVVIILMLATHEMLDVKKEKNYNVLSKAVFILANTCAPFLIFMLNIDLLAILSVYIILTFVLQITDANLDFNDLGYLIAFSLYVILSATFALYLRSFDEGFYLIVFVVGISAFADSFAYLIGKRYGKHKLIERISPNKTKEGSIGGLIAGTVFGVIFSILFTQHLNNDLFNNIFNVIAISLLLSAMGQVGDLLFSSIKRAHHIKDFSNFLPGHGGILDRVDSHLTNLMIFGFILMFII